MAIGSDIPYYFLPSPKFPTPSKIHNPVTIASSNTGKKKSSSAVAASPSCSRPRLTSFQKGF
jgi:hypothetical protein